MRGFADAWDVGVALLAITDDPVATHLSTDAGDLPFQRYFVERRCAPAVSAIRFEGAATARAAPGVLQPIAHADAILNAPSNPWLSVDPILAVPEIRAALAQAHVPIVAVSPIIGGQSVKGPTAKLMGELGLAVTNTSIAAHYGSVIDGLLIDGQDREDNLGIPYAVTDTLMTTLEDRTRVARVALDFAAQLAG